MSEPNGWIQGTNGVSVEIVDAKARQQAVQIQQQLDGISGHEYHIKGKNIVFFGDSICAGAGTTGGYASPIQRITGCVCANLGVGGATVANIEGTHAKIVNIVREFSGNADMIVIQGGVNDFHKGVALGEITGGYSDTLDDTTFCGALETIIQTLMTNYPQAQLFGVFSHRDVPDSYTNSNSVSQKDFRDKAVAIYEKYAIPCYDLYRDSGLITASVYDTGVPAFFKAKADAFTVNGDKTHPNEAGYARFYVPQIINLLERHCPIEHVAADDEGSEDTGGTPETISINMDIAGFTRKAGTFSTASSGMRSALIQMDGVQSITIKVGANPDACPLAFFDASQQYLADISLAGTPDAGGNYGWIERTIDVTGQEYSAAAYFVVSSYHTANGSTLYPNNDNDFSYDSASYVKLT